MILLDIFLVLGFSPDLFLSLASCCVTSVICLRVTVFCVFVCLTVDGVTVTVFCLRCSVLVCLVRVYIGGVSSIFVYYLLLFNTFYFVVMFVVQACLLHC